MKFDHNTNVSKLNAKELAEYVAWLQAENARIRTEKAQAGKLSLKVSSKGAVSVYGMGRFPVTLYREQWERLIAYAPQIEKFMVDNAALLSSKGDKEEEKAPVGNTASAALANDAAF